MGIVRFGNDHFTAITGYGDYVQGNNAICHVYYVEGLGHILFLVGQFCDGDLEVAFRSNTCYVRNMEGDDLLTGSRDSNLYTISISEMAAYSLVYLMSRATSTKSWLWHHKLSHLNFAREQGKSKKASFPPKLFPSTESKLKLLHMDLCGPMRVASINGKKYILVIVDDYSRTPGTDNGTEFKNEKLRAFYAKLVQAARTMLIYSKTPNFLWAEAIATTCFTQNRSIVHTQYNKTPYELIRGRKPNIRYFHVFGSLCYPTNDCDDLGKMKPKADIGIFIGYFESSRGFHELTTMASECNNSEPGINCMNFQDSLEDSQSVPSKTNLDNLFGPLYEEYYETSSPEVSDNSAANTLNNDNISSSSSIIVEEDEAPQIVSLLAYQVATKPNSPVLNENADEFVQEDVADFDENVFYNVPPTLVFEEAESSSAYQDPSNMHENQLQTNAEVCMYALTVSTIEPKNIKKTMLDASWIESVQDELNQCKRLVVWELVECPIGRNIIAVRCIWKNKTDAENMVTRNKSHLVAKGYVQEEGFYFDESFE
ncbi:retrovirus-related pol polyprotein from transposon TNT 1-94, partial [Tanacetum coccineum]